MRVLFLCGVFAEENQQEIIDAAKKTVEYSANEMQKKLIQGFQECQCELDVLSAPFIGSYPGASKISKFNGFREAQEKYHYVKFNNVWGIRNFSRAKALKKEVRSFAEHCDKERMIVVYSPHTPFLEAAVYAKKLDPTIRICLVLPDLPHYMNLNANVSMIYKVAKKVDIGRFEKLNQYVDSYMLLTEAMKEKVDVHEKPYIVAEGIVYNEPLNSNAKQKDTKTIVYTGKLNEKFGVKNLVDAFVQIKYQDYRLILCGKGDAEDYIIEKSKKDTRIVYMGQVTPEEANRWILDASVLVNPRQNSEEYTKYSFPSKNIEYLLSGNPVVAYMMEGMPDVYSDFMYVVSGNTIESLVHAIEQAMNDTSENKNSKFCKASEYLKTLTAKEIAYRLLKLNEE